MSALGLSFAGKVALITGGSSGIGAATAVLLSKLGCSVALGGRDKQNLEGVASKCFDKERRGDARVLQVQGDLKKDKDVKTLLNTTVKIYGKLDILVNCASILPYGCIETASLNSYDEAMHINVRSVFQLTQLAVPYLIETQGCIVNVSSVHGLRSFPGVLAYNMSKSALDQFTQTVALELAPKNVRCNSVNPGANGIMTNLPKHEGLNDEAYQKFLERAKQTHALGQPGEVEEVAIAIAFLASSSDAASITGVTLPVDGRRHAMYPS